jgi:hypothetical protein
VSRIAQSGALLVEIGEGYRRSASAMDALLGAGYRSFSLRTLVPATDSARPASG